MTTRMSADDRLKSYSRNIRRRVYEYLTDKDHRREFEEWYLKKYGKKYKWIGVDCKTIKNAPRDGNHETRWSEKAPLKHWVSL